MADLSKVKIGGTPYDLKDATARTGVTEAKGLIATEKSRAEGVESGLDTRISNLEARGRYLSTWDAATGLPGDYPTIPEGAESPYTYTFKTGDYYIINNIPASGTKYMPNGASITATKEGETWTWTVGKTAYTGETSLVVGGQFLYSTTGWNYVATAKDVAWGNIIGNLSDQTDLSNALAAKANTTDLGELAFADTASGTVAGQTISGVRATGDLTAKLTGDLGATSTAASLTYSDFTPAGTINGSAISGGSINVTVKDADTATAVTDLTYENYTPAGTIAAKSTGGTSAVLATAKFEADSDGTAVTGTVSKPNVTITAGTEKTFATGLTGGSVASFTEGEFTPAAIQSGFYTAGSDASLSAGTQASLTNQTTNKFAKKAHNFTIGTGEDAETLIITEVATTDTTFYGDAVTDRGTFTANTLQTLTGGKATVIDTTKFSGGSKAADSFTANTLQSVETGTVHDTPTAALAEAPTFTGDKFRVATTTDTVLKDVEFTGIAAAVKLTGAKYLKQEIDEKSFTGTAATLEFNGTTVKNTIVSGVNYDKATKGTLAATASLPEGGLFVGDITVQAKDVTVSAGE